MHGLSASFVASGLRAGTQYRFMVAAKNLVGRGAWSAPATATTRAPSEKPTAPTAAPEPMLGETTACNSIALRAPGLRAGCGADRELVLEMAAAEHNPPRWRAATATASEHGLTATGLDPKAAYIFRVRARNAIGTSEPGPPSWPILPGGTSEALRNAPRVEAISSSAYRVMWGAEKPAVARPACGLPQLLWRLEYKKTIGAMEWETLLEKTEATQFEPQIRCPSGCRFRVFATNLNGWSEPSAASDPLTTRQLHPPARGAARLEVVLQQTTVASASALPKQFEREVADALEISAPRVHLVELRDRAEGSGKVVIFDVQPASHAYLSDHHQPSGAGLWSEPDEDTLRLAQQLAMQLIEPRSALRRSPLLSHVDADAGLMHLSEDGSVSHIGAWVPPPAPPPNHGGSDGDSGGSGWLVWISLALAALWYFCFYKGKGGYEKVSTPPQFELSEDVFDDYRRKAGRRMACTRMAVECGRGRTTPDSDDSLPASRVAKPEEPPSLALQLAEDALLAAAQPPPPPPAPIIPPPPPPPPPAAAPPKKLPPERLIAMDSDEEELALPPAKPPKPQRTMTQSPDGFEEVEAGPRRGGRPRLGFGRVGRRQ